MSFEVLVGNLWKGNNSKNISSDTYPWRLLHRSLPTLVSLLAMYACGSEHYYGKVLCQDRAGPANPGINALCYENMYTIKRQTHRMHQYGAVPGLGPLELSEGDVKKELRYHWSLPLVLLVLCTLMQLPYRIWKWFEGPAYNGFVHQWRIPTFDTNERHIRERGLKDFLRRYCNNGSQEASVMLLCMSMNIVISVVLLMVTDNIYDGDLFSHLIGKEEHFWVNHFPSHVKCSYQLFGVSGTGELQDLVCFLPINRFYSKFFQILMYSLLTLTGMLTVNVLYQALILNVVPFRVWHMRRQIKRTPNGLPTDMMLSRIVSPMSSSTFLALKTLSENVDAVTMCDFLIAYDIEEGHSV
jgi:hypothetical protein